MTDTISKAELAQLFRDMADRIDPAMVTDLRHSGYAILPAGKAKRARKAKAPPPTVSIAPDEMTFRRQRGWVNHFCKLEGKEWIGEGPNPLDPHCKIDKRILQEFAGTLEQVREKIADERAMRERERV